MDYTFLQIEKRGVVTLISISRPKTLNAVDAAALPYEQAMIGLVFDT